MNISFVRNIMSLSQPPDCPSNTGIVSPEWLCLSSHHARVWDVVRGEDITVGWRGSLLRVPGEERGLFWHPDTGGVPRHHHRAAVPALRAAPHHGRAKVRGSPGVGRVNHVGVLLGPHRPPGQLQHTEAGLGTILLRSPGLGAQLTLLEGADNTTGDHEETNHGDQHDQHETEVPLGL